MNEIEERKQILARCTQGNIFCFHDGEGYLRLKLAFPDDRAVGNTNDISSSATDAVWVLGVFVAVETGKVSIGKAVYVDVLRGPYD
jgi:hypothetical protein